MAKAVSLYFDVIGRDKGAGKVLDDLGGKAQNTHKGLGGVSAGLAGMAAPAAGALAAIGGIAIGFGQMAAEAEQNVGAVETVFGSAAKKVEDFSKRSATAVGLSASSYNELSATTGTALKAAGYSVDELAEKNDALITRGADLASVFGGTTADAVRAMGSAFRGEFDPLERYGVTLTMNQVNAELAARGYDKLQGAALESAKKQTIHDLIMQQSAQSAGNFAKEADTTAGAQQRATAAFGDASVKLGNALLPAMTKFAEIATTVATWVAENSDLVTKLAVVLGILAGGIVVATGVMGILNIVMAANPVGAVILAVTALIAVIALLVLNWDKVVAFLRGSWDGFTKWWSDGMRRMGDQWNGFWGDVGRNAQGAWDRTLGPVFNTIRDFIMNKVPAAFQQGVGFVQTHWNRLQEVAKAPVRFLVNTVINDGLIGTFNTVAGWVGIGKLGRVGLPAGFAGGGYTGEGGKYEPAGVVHRGEYVFTKEQTERAGVTTLSKLARSLSGYADGGFVNPVPSARISQPFHAGHNGIDLAAPTGTPVQAAFGGNVSFAQWSPYGGGNEIHIDHAGGWQTWYAHLSNFNVRQGMTVNRGQRIGLVGSTGNSTGPHLHYMVLRGGWPNTVNPAAFMSGVMPENGPVNPIAGIIDGLVGAMRSAFPAGQIAAELALGFGKKVLGEMSGFVGKKLGFGSTGGPQLFDNGGWMQSSGVNMTGKPEAVFTDRQWTILEANMNKPIDLSGYSLKLNADATMATFERIAADAVNAADDDLYRGRTR